MLAKTFKLIFRACLAGLPLLGACAEKTVDSTSEAAAGLTYSYDWESLRRAPIPAWFEDAKFGIFIHWGPYSVPGWSDGEDYAEWYSTRMYRKESFIRHHREHYGEPGAFGYKDFIPLFRAEKFDAARWSRLFKQAGAKYVIPTGEHHDGFVMWDTELTPWNAVDMGPKFDFIGLLGEAVRAEGLKYGISYHRERHWGFYTDGLNTYKENPEPLPAIVKEIEETPRAESLYGPFGMTEAFMRDYKARFLEIAGKYQPDFMWIDDSPANSLFPEAPAVDRFINKYHLEMIVDYMNMAQRWGKEVYFNNKRWRRSNYPDGAGVDEKDYLRMSTISPIKWHSSGGMDHSYSYDVGEDERDSYKSVDQLVETLIDVVSKNGNFLLGIGPKSDGTIPENQRRRLTGIGEWLQDNGEAVYGTRPWKVHGAEGVRFTRKDNILYALLFDWPEGEFALDVTMDIESSDIDGVELLGDKGGVEWRIVAGMLMVQLVGEPSKDHAHVIKLSLKQ